MEGSFHRLTLVAEPKMLGQLRDKLDSATADMVVQTIDKNWTRHERTKIQELLEG